MVFIVTVNMENIIEVVIVSEISGTASQINGKIWLKICHRCCYVL
jgi:hypothetical protein